MSEVSTHSARRWGWTAMRTLGLGLSLACCGWIGAVLWREISNHGLATSPLALAEPFAFAVIAGILVNTCLGVAWRELVAAQGVNLSYWDSIGLSWRVQIAKYIPGNVFHFASRVILAQQLGVPRGVATKATVLEPVGMVVLAGVFSLRWWGSFVDPNFGFILLLGGLVIGVLMIAWRKGWPARWRDEFSVRLSVRGILTLGFSFLALFTLLTMMFAGFLGVVGDAVDRSIITLGEMVTASWLVGFVAVGAPGGLGVREATLTLFSVGPADANALLFVGVLTRGAMVVADAVSLILGTFLLRKHHPAPAPP